ncbi:MAG TPA: LON peptidase substrate-binding domain-containing protein [Alphaproteobacteria bacterium]|nr:LON peptidase substrate-binding domain-containing protein [Alphaproteobacteria bacterium]
MSAESTSSSSVTEAPSALPEVLPIFPLAGALLLPRGRLPLNIFEPRYVAMIEDALGHGRLIGMVQPTAEIEGEAPPLYTIGCAGRITSFTETDDGRFLIGLTGLCRFAVAEELEPDRRGYRRVRPDWQNFLADLGGADDSEIDRERLLGILRNYFKMQSIAADWNAVQGTGNEMLVSSLAMICPLAPNEKQALLEAPDLRRRAELLVALLEMASMPSAEAEGAARH